MKTLLLIPALVGILGCATLTANNQTFIKDEGAIRGYDPVAYFVEGRPVKGKVELTQRYQGATWYFANEQNRQAFKEDTEKYTPQYGGYCAYAMSKGFLVSTNPEAWTVHNDKLYLNYSLGVRKTWLKDVPGYVKKGDGHWTNKLRTGIRS